MYHSIARLWFLPSTYLFWICTLLALCRSHVFNDGPDLDGGHEHKDSTASSSNYVLAAAEIATTGADLFMANPEGAVVVVTVTTIETINVESVTTDIDAPDDSTTLVAIPGGSNDDQHEIVPVTYTPAVTGTGTSNADPVGTISTNKASLLADTKTRPHHPSSTYPTLQGIDEDNVIITSTTFVTITVMPTPSPSTSSINEANCQMIFCNTLGEKVCMTWEGFTGWDASRGVIPGEVPTIIGTCTE
ncbi:hypothetical protein F5Y01DRAFT_310732 [Xylaria sp. FL0043]|nr:hypothetical protein F5Y01DRAFT_310732 [Xylaria sp. FL0043]